MACQQITTQKTTSWQKCTLCSSCLETQYRQTCSYYLRWISQLGQSFCNSPSHSGNFIVSLSVAEYWVHLCICECVGVCVYDVFVCVSPCVCVSVCVTAYHSILGLFLLKQQLAWIMTSHIVGQKVGWVITLSYMVTYLWRDRNTELPVDLGYLVRMDTNVNNVHIISHTSYSVSTIKLTLWSHYRV